MKIITTILVILLTIATGASSTPRMELSENQFVFGFAPQYAKISHVFWVKSTGDDTLKITKVVPGCGCTRMPLEKDILPPGDSTRLEIIFSTKSYRNQIIKAPTVHTN